jgi:ferrous iron transport protein B
MTLVVLAGNPNCGKTTIFNALTGARHHVGNYSGVTVERRSGRFAIGGVEVEILDLPGVYSLSAHSEDERIAAEELARNDIDLIINILDASNLERNLYLTTQLIELRRPMIFVINMIDDAEKTGKAIDVDKLRILLGSFVIPTIGSRQDGILELRGAIRDMITQREEHRREIPIAYGEDIEGELQKLEAEIRLDERLAEKIVPRWLALGLLENDPQALRLASECHASRAIEFQRSASATFLEGHLGEDGASLIAERRYGFAHGLCAETVRATGKNGLNLTEKLDAVLTHRWLGIPIFIAVLMAMYAITFVLGKFPQDWIAYAFDNMQVWASVRLPHGELANLLVNGIIPGVGAVVVFLPVIMVLMGCISFLEDTGYMARTAFIMDRLMHLMGLHGKSFIPLIMGTGCNVPAIQATRTIEAKDDRLITILVSPLISCSARLQVYILLAGAFFAPLYAVLVVIGLHFLSFGTAMVMGKILRWTLFRGDTTPFVMELPPYRMPVLKSTLIHMWEKGRTFLTRAGTGILAGATLIWFLSHYPGVASRELANEYTQNQLEIKSRNLTTEAEQSVLEQLEAKYQAQILNTSFAASFGKFIQPALKPILDPDGTRRDVAWKDGVALTAGLVAKEIVVSTTAIMYKIPSSDEASGSLSLKTALRRDSGMTPLTAFSFLVFLLLYTPCVATVSMIYKETRSLMWSAFTVAYGLILAWGMSWTVVSAARALI